MTQLRKLKYCGVQFNFRSTTSLRAIVFVFIILLHSLFSFGQTLKSNLLWVGQHNNYMRIDSDAIRVNYSWDYNGKPYFQSRGHKYKFSNDTLRILEQGFHRNESYEYVVKEFSSNKLVLTAINHNFRTLDFEDSVGRTLEFVSQDKIATDSIQFEQLLFSTTNCYGFCPAMTFQIDNTGLLKFKGEKHAVKQGFYQAKLSKELLQELNSILGLSELDKVRNNNHFNIDASTHTLDIYYNRKVKYIKTAFVPFVLDKLLAFLLNIPQRIELKSIDEFEFKFSQ